MQEKVTNFGARTYKRDVKSRRGIDGSPRKETLWLSRQKNEDVLGEVFALLLHICIVRCIS